MDMNMDMDVGGIKDIDSNDVNNDEENKSKDNIESKEENEYKRNYKSMSSVECNNDDEEEESPSSSSSSVGASLFQEASTDGEEEKNERNERKKTKTIRMNEDLDCNDREKKREKIQKLISSLEALQSRIDEVIAFPTASNFTKLHHQASSTHQLFVRLSRMIEFGEIKTKTTDETKHNHSQSQSQSQSQSTTSSMMIDETTRTELTSYGTNIWLNVQNNPDMFRDFIASSISSSSSRSASTAAKDDENMIHDSIQAQKLKLEKERTAASGYIRSLACRLILISKIKTKDMIVPQLIQTQRKGNKGNNKSSKSSQKYGASTNSLSSSSLSTVPLALNGELEFAFKCLCRAGRAILHHSSTLASSTSSLPDVYDPSAAYSTLSLALVFWDGIDLLQRVNKDQGKKCLFLEEAFDAMLSLPDCATLIVTKRDDNSSDASNENHDTSIGCQDDNEVTSLVLKQLQRLEDFVNRQVSSGENKNIVNNVLKSIQHYLPSLARISYKHGNRLARLSEFSASREALRIALISTDKCLAMIRERLECKDGENDVSANAKRSFQIQEQEMLVLSKQSFYVLSHVCRSVGKTAEAKKCLDRIEVYINEQMQKDEQQYKEAMKHATRSSTRGTESFSGMSGFDLEGPKKQDIAEIKARLASARTKSKHGERMERMNLAYSRIMIHTGDDMINLDDEEEKQNDVQFQLMTQLVNDIESNIKESNVDSHFLMNAYASPEKHKDTFNLTLSAARSIFVYRQRYSTKIKFRDPYDILFLMYPKGHERNMSIRLELLNALLVAVQDSRGRHEQGQGSKSLDSKLDQRALDVGKQLISQVATSMNDISRRQTVSEKCTLFSKSKGISDIGQVLKDSREYFTRAVSLYYLSENGHTMAIEWCNLLIEILRESQQFSYVTKKEEIQQECFDHVIAEIMSTKALSLSMSNCHGAALKTAREAWGKYTAEVGCLVALFHCSVQYEAFSDQDESGRGVFDKSLFELDDAISSFSSSSKNTTSSEANHDKLLEAFPVMCNTAVQIEKCQTGPLSFGLQKRYLDLLVNLVLEKVSQSYWNIGGKDGMKCSIPGENNVFSILCSYLGSFDTILSSSDCQLSEKWYFEQFQGMRNTLDNILNLLVSIRDQGTKSEDSLLKFSESFKESEPPSTVEEMELLLDSEKVCQVVGSSADCLWIGEQLWNIATQIVTKKFTKCNSGHSHTNDSHRLHAADLFSKAHDFALFSEEEYGSLLTKGHLACENFDGKHHKDKMLDFTSKVKLESTDICSEFSAQCLLINVAHVLDDINDQIVTSQEHNSHIDCLSKEQERILGLTMNCLIATMGEIQVLGNDMNQNITKQVVWLALTLLIILKDDTFCSIILNKRGLLSRLELELIDKSLKNDDEMKDRTDPSPLDRIFLLIPLAENFCMNETAKILLKLCSKYSLQNSSGTSMSSNSIQGSRANTPIDFSVGLIQRKIIHLASRVEEVVDVFTSIDECVKKYSNAGNDDINHIQNQENQHANECPYRKDDIDYFVIEAHNRAVSLLYIGDFMNAEKLLTVALNLLPHSGKGVECHGAEIRKVYRGVIQRRCNNGESFLSMSSDTMIGLFDNV